MTESANQIVSLLSAHRAGDPDACGRLLAHFQQDLWGFLVNHLPSREDAEDMYQDISLKLMNHAGDVRDDSRFRSWLFSVAHNAVRSYYRNRKPEADPEQLERRPTPEDKGPHANVERNERALLLRRCLAKLPERDREMLLMDSMAELPQAEIAAQFDLNLNTVKTILRRARIKLARLMTEAAHG